MDYMLIVAVFGTALLSGVFGMAGGLVLLLVLSMRMPLPEAMVLHGAAQLLANGTRALVSARHIQWSVMGPYLVAGLAMLLTCRAAGVVLSTALALLVTGALPWLEPLLSRARLPAVDQRFGSLLCGALVTGLHLTAGVSGPLLDLFFVRSAFKRHEVVATKAATQCLGHLFKIAYFGVLASSLPMHGASAWLTLCAASVAGTLVGRQLLDRIDEAFFRRGSRLLIRGTGLACLVRGVALV